MYGLLDLDGHPLIGGFDGPPIGESPASAPSGSYGTTTIGPMPIEPSRADTTGSKADGSVGGRAGKSHRLDVVAPGAIHVQVQQVNWPDLPQELLVVRIAEDHFQTRTRGVVPAAGGGSTRVTAALIFVRVVYPDGQAVYHPPQDRLITYEEIAKYPIRPGLQPGNRSPWWVAKTQVITLSAPAAGGAGTSEDSGVGGAGGTVDTPAAPGGISPWVVAGAVAGAGAVGWFVLRALGVLGRRVVAPDPWPATPRWPV